MSLRGLGSRRSSVTSANARAPERRSIDSTRPQRRPAHVSESTACGSTVFVIRRSRAGDWPPDPRANRLVAMLQVVQPMSHLAYFRIARASLAAAACLACAGNASAEESRRSPRQPIPPAGLIVAGVAATAASYTGAFALAVNDGRPLPTMDDDARWLLKVPLFGPSFI